MLNITNIRIVRIVFMKSLRGSGSGMGSQVPETVLAGLVSVTSVEHPPPSHFVCLVLHLRGAVAWGRESVTRTDTHVSMWAFQYSFTGFVKEIFAFLCSSLPPFKSS